MREEQKLQVDVILKLRTQPGHGCSSPDLNIFGQIVQKLPIIYDQIKYFLPTNSNYTQLSRPFSSGIILEEGDCTEAKAL